MQRYIYHGSQLLIKEPQFGYGNIHNDYGLGFYCTNSLILAKEWASKASGYGYANKYRFNDNNLKILDLTKPPYNDVLTWIAILFHFRFISEELKNNYPRELAYLEKHYYRDVSQYDVVIGYRADDAYFYFPEAFIRSEITLEDLNKVYLAGDLGKQYVLISKKAFARLHFVDSYEVSPANQAEHLNRIENATLLFSNLSSKSKYNVGTRLIDLVRKEK